MKSILFIALLFTAAIVTAQNMNHGEMLTKEAFYQTAYMDTKVGTNENVTIKGETYKFILDTGAPLCISTSIQDKYRFSVIDTTIVHDSNNQTGSSLIVMVDTLSFGGIMFSNIPAVVLDFKNSPVGENKVEGLLGSNVMRFLTIQFDIRHGLITFTNNNSRLPVLLHNGFAFTTGEQSDAYISLKLYNGFSDSAHFDSGMRDLYQMNLDAAKKYIVSQQPAKVILRKKLQKTNLGIFGDSKPDKHMKLRTDIFCIGVFILKNINFITTPAKSRIGRELLKYGVFTLDYPSKIFYFEQYVNLIK
jgi:hypothetical protein